MSLTGLTFIFSKMYCRKPAQRLLLWIADTQAILLMLLCCIVSSQAILSFY